MSSHAERWDNQVRKQLPKMKGQMRVHERRLLEALDLKVARAAAGDLRDEDLIEEIRTFWYSLGRVLTTKGGYEKRVAWLVEAGWDPGGWALMSWTQLPRQLRKDLASSAIKAADDHTLAAKLGFDK